MEAFDEELDLALIRCPEHTHCGRAAPLSYAPMDEVKFGAVVYAFGSARGLDLTVTKGIISHLGRKIAGHLFIQTDLAINPGNSGGPMLDEWGRVVGIVTAKRGDAEGIGFVRPVEYLAHGWNPRLRKKMKDVSWGSGFSPAIERLLERAPEILPPGAAEAARAAEAEGAETTSIEVLQAVTNGSRLGLEFRLVAPIDEPFDKRQPVFVEFQQSFIEVFRARPNRTLQNERRGTARYTYEFAVDIPRGYALSGGTPARLKMGRYVSPPFAFRSVYYRDIRLR